MLGTKLIKAAAGNAAEETDPNFNQTVLLLHGDGSNGAQNNTFLDSSSNGFTITRNGNTTQGTFSPFSTQDGGWSNYFPGASNYLSVANNSAISFGTGDFTFEFWVLMPLVPSGTTWFLFDKRSASNTTPWAMAVDLNNGGSVYWYDGTVRRSSISVTPNVWQHYAITRSSGTLKMWVNGVEAYSATVTLDLSGAGNLLMGCRVDLNSSTFLPGYLSNVRAVKGTALYTSAFTPSTSPLTTTSQGATASEVGLLTCQSNRFVDNSTNNFAITRNGDVKVTPFSPFAPSAAWSASVNGGSMYADGSAASLTWSGTTLTGDFTVECWVYSTAVDGSGYTNILSYTTGNEQFTIDNTNVGSIGLVLGGSIIIPASGTAVTKNAWHHLAWVCERSTNTFRAYVDGVQQGSGTSTRTTTVNKIAQFRGGGFELNGYMSDLRIIAGTCLYPSGTTFTPPTGPLTNITNTSLLLNFTNAGIYNNALSGGVNLETIGNSQIDTTTKVFGTGSVELDGSGDYLVAPVSSELTFGTGDFTIEMWIYLNSVSGVRLIYDVRTAVSQATIALFLDDDQIKLTVSGSVRITSGTVTTGTWYHLALARSGTSTKMFLDGVQTGSTYTDSTNYLMPGPLNIGRYPVGNSYFYSGLIDDLRITKGVARYTTTFTPPTKAFPDL